MTGASSGIGEAVAKAAIKQGHKVIVTARRHNRIQELANEFGEQSAIAFPMDVTNIDEVTRVVELALKKFNTIDVVVNNAGIMPLSHWEEKRYTEWMQTIDVNVKGVLNVIYGILDALKLTKGHMINVSSVAGHNVYDATGVYCASKHAVRVISESLRKELADVLRVTNISPGVVDTELVHSIQNEQIKADFMAGKGIGNSFVPLDPEDIAKAIMFTIEEDNIVVNEIILRPKGQII
ncbi:SDR family oxidoreductase [Bacillus cereus]|uniref:SDR family oxidoreductase n=1 Tax=Bacillus cereus TaxID=1396 RepID=UPI00240A806A|nr:SDR family oxidoreductase [Bacillus cereus]